MTCGQCEATDQKFDVSQAEADLARFLRQGPDASTRLILDAIRRHALPPSPTLLDIGGGIGTLHQVLLDEGFASAIQVDASGAYLAVSRAEAGRRGHGDRLTLTHADFHAAAATTPPADVVTLDRVVCCDRDYAGLLGAAAQHARHLLSLSYPRDRWYNRLWVASLNAMRWLRRNAFRTFVHSPQAMTQVLEQQGLRRSWQGGTWIWQVELFERVPGTAVPSPIRVGSGA